MRQAIAEVDFRTRKRPKSFASSTLDGKQSEPGKERCVTTKGPHAGDDGVVLDVFVYRPVHGMLEKAVPLSMPTLG